MQMNTIISPDAHLSFSEALLDTAFSWLKQQRKGFPPDADIWHLWLHWSEEKHRLLSRLNADSYLLSPVMLVRNTAGSWHGIWSATDALVIKCIAILTAEIFPSHARCEHLRGHGGGPRSVRRLSQRIQKRDFRYVCRTDIRHYYASINKSCLYDQCCRYVSSPCLQHLLWQFIHYSVEYGGNIHTPSRGISRANALSPLLAALHLHELDKLWDKHPSLWYVRYMDDIVILATCRWHLRNAVKILKEWLRRYGFQIHPDKTFIGRICKGFDWMGAWISATGITQIAPRAMSNHHNVLLRLYERIRYLPALQQQMRVEQYLIRWNRWAESISGREMPVSQTQQTIMSRSP
ncbi:RNA-directed DNA polymerase [Enterobacter roggenkampii]|uniref:RNA-directed DNA polymerase n=1 Tax=Enterobacter roggenkampii TaxID=1812935 RepID=UPI002DB78C2C|nr:RNA-directed DNA polymerase [Enterobacter roggenkampii]MEB5889992.1 RNA-directed DNA polymerase [Enterobacter roggenkampii]